MELNGLLCDGFEWCGVPVKRLICYAEDGSVLADVTVPMTPGAGDTDFAATKLGKSILEKLADGAVKTVKQLATELDYTPHGWFRKVVTGMLKQGQLIQAGRGKYKRAE